MNRYAEYKQVDLPWLKEIPSHWRIFRNKGLFKGIKKTVGDGFKREALLSLTTKGVKVKDFSDTRGKQPTSYATYQKVEEGNLVLCLFDLDCSAVFSDVSKYKGMISPAYDVLEILRGNKRFYKYLFDYLFQDRVYKIFSKSVRYTVTLENFYSLESIVPSLKEQEQIANYLDWKINEIEHLIIVNSHEVDSLELAKKTLMFDILKNAKGWKLVSLVSLLDRKSIRLKDINEEKQLLSVTRERGIIVRDIEDRTENRNVISDDLSNYKVVNQGDFVVNKMKAWQGSYGISELEGIVSPAYYVFKFTGSKEIDSEFFHKTIRNRVYIDEFARLSKGIRTDQWDFPMIALRNINFYYPSLEEQQKILEKVKLQEEKIEKAILILKEKIEALEALKNSLIAEVVTGQLDVRNVVIPEYTRVDMPDDVSGLDSDVDELESDVVSEEIG